jgi:cysteine sulfinate desulfinase/cysteine desulfurase-like protein
MGVDRDLAIGAVRFSLGHDTTDEDIHRAVAEVPGVAATLRRPV